MNRHYKQLQLRLLRSTPLITTLFLVALLGPSSAAAGERHGWAEVVVGGSMYSMGSVNDEIELVDASSPAYSVDNLENGFYWGGAVGLTEGGSFAAALAYEYLRATKSSYPESAGTRYHLPGHKFTIRVMHKGRASADRFANLGIGLGVGTVYTRAEVETEAYDFDSTAGKMSGFGLALEVFFRTDLWLNDFNAFTIHGGWRFAKVGAPSREDGEIVTSADGSDYEIDYTGMYLGVGLKFGRRSP